MADEQREPIKLVTGPQDMAGCENVVPMATWVKAVEEKQGVCPPCMVSAIAPWYRDLLRQQGFENLASTIQALADREDLPVQEAAAILDNAKAGVNDELTRLTLTLYDCMAQSYDAEPQEE